jgi:mutator protein MutT
VPAPSDREFPSRPIVGVGAIIVDGDAVLLVRRLHEPLKGQWSLPGGAVEVGETLDAAIAREVREEAGIEIDVGPVVEVLDRIRLDTDGRARFHYVLVDFLCRLKSGRVTAGSDADAASWVDVDALAAHDVAAGTVSVIQKAFARHRAGDWAPRGGYARLE